MMPPGRPVNECAATVENNPESMGWVRPGSGQQKREEQGSRRLALQGGWVRGHPRPWLPLVCRLAGACNN